MIVKKVKIKAALHYWRYKKTIYLLLAAQKLHGILIMTCHSLRCLAYVYDLFESRLVCVSMFHDKVFK